jgi:hypothetical protein
MLCIFTSYKLSSTTAGDSRSAIMTAVSRCFWLRQDAIDKKFDKKPKGEDMEGCDDG